MAEVDSLPSGSFCWIELATTDQRGAVAFYRDLFAWDVNEQPIGEGETYSLFRIRGKDVASAYTMRPEERQSGAPPRWNAYVKTASADDSAKRAQELGGTVVAPAFDVGEWGRMAVLQDPTGAVFEVWQPKTHQGIGITNEAGALCWTELTTTDTKKAETFYTQLFGWTPKHSSGAGGMDYTEFSIGGRPSIGMLPMPPNMPAGTPPFWIPYFQVGDVDASAAKGKALGGAVHVGPNDIPGAGRFAILGDPQNAMFAIYTPKAQN